MRSKKNGRSLRRTIVVAGILFFIFACVILFSSLRDWAILKSGVALWEAKLHKPDAELGYVPICGASGAVVLPNGSKSYVYYDSQGFRVSDLASAEATTTFEKNSVLALGCSFTFGFGVQAEDTFCNLVADKLQLTPLNAGKCSAGLAEMLIMAGKLIPKFKPGKVLVQFSPWLAERSTQRYGPTVHGFLPHPYFVNETRDIFRIQYPDFMSHIFDYGFTKSDLSDKSVRAFINFTLTRKLPLLVNDWWNISSVFAQEMTGMLPRPSQDINLIIRYAYGQIASICNLTGSEMIVVCLGIDDEIPIIPECFSELNVQIVNAQLALVKKLKIDSVQEYARSYYHWGGKSAKIVDRHPNSLAHKTIADEIVSVISQKKAIWSGD